MIEAILGLRNENLALAKCDECAVEHSMKAQFGDTKGPGNDKLKRTHTLHDPAGVIRKLEIQGWSNIKNRLRCPACEAKRKQIKEPAMQENVTPLRQPTREQKRQITELLQGVYDLNAERYKGGETDLTVAEAIGGGCMFGWVAEIREAMFGPDGGNEAIEQLTADIALWRDNAAKIAASMSRELDSFNDARAKVKEMQDRLTAIAKAAGPRARSA